MILCEKYNYKVQKIDNTPAHKVIVQGNEVFAFDMSSGWEITEVNYSREYFPDEVTRLELFLEKGGVWHDDQKDL